MKSLKIYTDGAARGNPGPAGIGVAVYSETDEVLRTYNRYLGETTNNVAEYEALIAGMKLARQLGSETIQFFLDSKLVVEQMKGTYRVKNQNLAGYFGAAQGLAREFKRVSYTHIPRERNAMADRLANEAIDAKKTDPGADDAPPSKGKTAQLELF